MSEAEQAYTKIEKLVHVGFILGYQTALQERKPEQSSPRENHKSESKQKT